MVRELPAVLREPGRRATFYRVYGETDLREILPTIRVPTLVLYRRELREQMLDLAQRIKGARAWRSKARASRISRHDARGRGLRLRMEAEPVPDTVLATVMFTDIVGSTERAAALGDRAWRELCTITTSSCGVSWRAFAARSSIRPVTASSRSSTGQPARSRALARSWGR